MSSIVSDSNAILDRGRFHALWMRCFPLDQTEGAMPVWGNIVKRYGEQHRYYHNNKHLAFCLQQLDSVTLVVRDTDAIEMAIWFHDVIFEPMASDNEARSAALFKIVTKACSSAPGFLDLVSGIIVATKHNSAPGCDGEAYMLDIDLASIGLPWVHFFQDSKDLRAELGGISDKRFYAAKLTFLHDLLQRPRIYFTEFFFTKYEARARENISRYTGWLESQGYR